jgi:hypothetical protein
MNFRKIPLNSTAFDFTAQIAFSSFFHIKKYDIANIDLIECELELFKSGHKQFFTFCVFIIKYQDSKTVKKV